MKIEIFSDPDAVANHAAAEIASQARSAIETRGQFTIAFSGGRTPLNMLRALSKEEISWSRVHVMQVDERIAPAGHPDRNLTLLQECLLNHVPLLPEQIHSMPVEKKDLDAAVNEYAETLRTLAGSPPVLDCIHLGLGIDGHTASLVPGDRVLDLTDTDVALTDVYQGRRRMTLTYPILERSRSILWLVIDKEKADQLVHLYNGDISIPAGRVSQHHAIVFADKDTAAKITCT